MKSSLQGVNEPMAMHCGLQSSACLHLSRRECSQMSVQRLSVLGETGPTRAGARVRPSAATATWLDVAGADTDAAAGGSAWFGWRAQETGVTAVKRITAC